MLPSTFSLLHQHVLQGSICSVSITLSRLENVQIPDYWRQETKDCLDDGVLDDESREDMTCILVTLLVAKYGAKPDRSNCEELVRRLILKYPFTKDAL